MSLIKSRLDISNLLSTPKKPPEEDQADPPTGGEA
jgi:hypothetical protein